MANSLNLAQVIGNLTRDPELRQTPNGQSVCTLGVATNRNWTNQSGQKQEAVEFHNIVVWGKLAEICAQYLQKGQKAYFAGRLQTRDWEAQDGQKRRTTEIIADQMIMLGAGKGVSEGAAVAPEIAEGPAAASSTGGVKRVKGKGSADDDIEKIDVNDLPF